MRFPESIYLAVGIFNPYLRAAFVWYVSKPRAVVTIIDKFKIEYDIPFK